MQSTENATIVHDQTHDWNAEIWQVTYGRKFCVSRYEHCSIERRDSNAVALGWTCAVLNGMHEGH